MPSGESSGPNTCSSLSWPPVGAATRGVVQTFPAAGRTSNQGTFEVAVIMPTILRPSILHAVRSVFAQDFVGTGQLLIGIDKADGDPRVLDKILAIKPANWAVSIVDPGYSTSVRHGGIHPATDGGAMRTILCYAAHSRYLAFLDDDNWWAPDHLSSLLKVIPLHQYAYSLRWYVDAATSRPICTDAWESVGPDRGVYREKFGGFIDPNTLMFDKAACDDVLGLWCIPVFHHSVGIGSDRTVFERLRTKYSGVATGSPTCFYRISPSDPMHPERLRLIEIARQRRINPVIGEVQNEVKFW